MYFSKCISQNVMAVNESCQVTTHHPLSDIPYLKMYFSKCISQNVFLKMYFSKCNGSE